MNMIQKMNQKRKNLIALTQPVSVVKYAVLLSIMDSYNQMTLDNTKVGMYNDEVLRVFRGIEKFAKSKRILLSATHDALAKKYYQKICDLDVSLFENKSFSPPILVLHLLAYLRDEIGDVELRVKFGHFNILKALDELERDSKIRDVAMYHAYVVYEKYVGAFDELLNECQKKDSV